MRALPYLCVLACVLALGGPAAAETADIDGDGKPDTVRIEPSGAVVVERAGGGGAFVPFGLSGNLGKTSLTIGGKGRPYVVAVAQIGSAWEAVALRWDKGAMKELWRGPVGPAGDDGEYEVWIEARPSGLVRWQRRADLDRCDGTQTELFREGWDDASGKWKPARPNVRFPDITATVKATASPALGAGWYRASGATTAAGATDAGQLVAPRVLEDGDPKTAWREDRGGDGSGEMFTFRTTMKGGRAAALRFVPGDAKGNRVRTLTVMGKGVTYRVDLPDAPASDALVASFPAPIEGCVTVAIVAVDRKGAANVTSIAELGVIADVELAPGGAETMLAAQVAKGGIAGESAARALAARGEPAVNALTAELQKADATSRPRILAALAKLRHPAVIAPIAEALAKGDLPEGDRIAAAELLASLGPDGTAALALVVSQPGDENGRLAVARVIAKTQPAELLKVVGQGSRGFRAAIVELLAGAGTSALMGWGRDVNMPVPARADVFRAEAKAASAPGITAEERTAVAKGLLEALEGWSSADTVAERTPEELYEIQYRLVAGLGEIGGSAEIRGLVAWLGRARDDARARALRRVAANALGKNAIADARLALANLAADRDAGTRLAAVRALASEAEGDTPSPHGAVTADDTAARDAGDRAIGTILSVDAWPELRRAAASALGVRCQRRGPRDALDSALERDADLAVRIDALGALVTCKSDGIAARLLAIADDGKQEPDLRDRAVALYGQLAPPGATAALLDRLDRWRGQAFSDESALRLAVRAVTALGVLGDGKAASALVSAARDGAFPGLQAAAAAALGALGKACPKDAIMLLRALAQNEQRSVSIAARGAISTCGQ